MPCRVVPNPLWKNLEPTMWRRRDYHSEQLSITHCNQASIPSELARYREIASDQAGLTARTTWAVSHMTSCRQSASSLHVDHLVDERTLRSHRRQHDSSSTQGCKRLVFKSIFLRFLVFFIVFKDFFVWRPVTKVRPKAHEKHPILSYLTPFSPFRGLHHKQLQALI